jgi:hypothetical protein
MTQCGLDRAGYISLLMATEQVNGIVRVTWTRATFQEFIGQSYCLSLKAKGYSFKVLLKRTRGLVLKEKFLFGIFAFGIFRMILLQVM